MNCPLFQNRTIQSPASKMRIAISVRLHEPLRASAADFGKRFSCHRTANQTTRAIPVKPIQIGQMFRTTCIVCSSGATGLPGPGNLGVEARTTGREVDPANDASQL